MTGTVEQLRAATLTLLMVTSLFAVAGIGGAADGDPSTYAVVQGGECWDVTAMGDGSQTVEEFYDYRSPETDPSSDYYSSFGTRHFQENQVSQLFVYNGSEGVSLVMVHDKMEDGPNASTTTFHFSGLPDTREWIVEDDDYQGRDDEFIHNGTESTIHWKWARHRSDGAAVRGLEDTGSYTAIEIQPGFNENAEYWGDWPYSGDAANETDAWKLITEPSSDNVSVPGNKVELNLDQNVTIEEGTCEDTSSPNADLTAPGTVETGQEFTFDASGSSDDEGIVSYEWDFDGDGIADDTTTEATVNHSYSQNGTYEASVTVSDAAGNNDTASATVTVVDPDDEPPMADLEVDPSEAEAGDEVTFDASNSSDNGQIVQYHWDFDGDGTVEASTEANTTTHTYSQTGEFDANVTVEDAGGNTDTATARVNVSDTTPPTANADVPEQVVKNTTFEVDGSASTDNGQIVSYEWDFGDNTTKNGSVVSHSYAENGTYTVTLTVTDGEGNENSTSAEVTVTDEDSQPPSAEIDARDSTTVGKEVTFDGSGSSDDGTIESYEWDFDDGTTKNGESVTHSFEEKGTYNVTLTVTDGAGNNDTATHQITIEEKSSDDEPPQADFTWERSTKSDKNIKFDASKSTDDDGIVKYEWDHDGDGKYTHKGVERTIPYDEFGTYNVTLKVTDTAGNVDTTTQKVVVKDLTAPTGEISAPDKVEVGETFTAKVIELDDESEITHICWFVDGKEVGGDFQKSLKQSFDEPGKHTLELRIADEHGNDVTLKHTVKVVEKSSGGGNSGGSNPGGSTGGSNDGGDDNDDASDHIEVDLGDAKSDEPFTVDLSTGTESGDGLAAFDTLTVTLTRSGDYDMTISTVEEAPMDVTEPTIESDGFEPLSYLVVDRPDLSEEDIADAEFTFTIEQSRLDALDADAENVQIYRYDDGSWTAVETEVVEETDDEVQFRASDSGLSTFVVAVDRPVVELADLSVSATEIAPGETVEITATLTNDGQASGSETFDIAVNGETVDEREVHVDANSERSITVSQTFDEPGTYTVSVNGQEVEVVVQAEETEMPEETPTTTTTTDGQAGFGVALAVLALLGAALLALRRR